MLSRLCAYLHQLFKKCTKTAPNYTELRAVKHKDLNLIPSTHGKKLGVVVCASVTKGWGVGRGQKDPWGLMAIEEDTRLFPKKLCNRVRVHSVNH